MAMVLAATTVAMATTEAAPVAAQSESGDTQVHQTAIFDGRLVQRSRLVDRVCWAAACWSEWFDRSDAEPPGQGRLTAVTYVVIADVLHEWVVRTTDDDSTVWVRAGGGAWSAHDVPGTGPITSFTSTVNGDGSVEQFYWRGLSRSADEQQAYRRAVTAADAAGLSDSLGGFVALPATTRATVFGLMRADLPDSVPDAALEGPVVSHTLFTDVGSNSVIQGIWIDTENGAYGYARSVARTANEDGVLVAKWDECTGGACKWSGPINDWGLRLGDVGGQTFHEGPNVVGARGEEPVNAHHVRLETLKGVPFCSGTLVSSDLVLTAAHCLYTTKGDQVDNRDVSLPRSLDLVQVRLRTESSAPGVLRKLKGEPIFAQTLDGDLWSDGLEHPGGTFPAGTLLLPDRHDLALVRLAAPAPVSVRPARFSYREPWEGQTITATGWDARLGTRGSLRRYVESRGRCPHPDEEHGSLSWYGGHVCVPTGDSEDRKSVEGTSGMGWRSVNDSLLRGVHRGIYRVSDDPYEVDEATAVFTPIAAYGEFLDFYVPNGVVRNSANRQRVMAEVSVPFRSGDAAICGLDPDDEKLAHVPRAANVVVTLEIERTTDKEAWVTSVQIGNLKSHTFDVPQFTLGVIDMERVTLPSAGEVTLIARPDLKSEPQPFTLFNGHAIGSLPFLQLEYVPKEGEPDLTCRYDLHRHLYFEMVG